VLVLTVLAGTVVGPSVVGALLAPGTDSVAARLAECGRDHGSDGLITWLEKQQYEHNLPPTGEMPVGGISRVAIASDTPSDPLDAVGLPARLLCPTGGPFAPPRRRDAVLSVRNVRMILQAVGVVRGMEPDINPNWVSGTNRHSMAHRVVPALTRRTGCSGAQPPPIQP
jgi:hypothetical protein